MGVINRVSPRKYEIPLRSRGITNEIISCNKVFLFRNRLNNSILCHDCIGDQSDPSNYNEEIRHYIHCGTSPIYEECSECCVILNTTVSYDNCSDCTAKFESFIIPALSARYHTPFYNIPITVTVARSISPYRFSDSDEDTE